MIMSLSSIAIKRPVFAVMLNMIFVIFGILSYNRIGVQEIPNITYPTIAIRTVLPGGSPKLVNQTVTRPIEEAVNSVSGIEHISSSSVQGSSLVQLQFALGSDMDAAYNKVLNKVNQTIPQLPTEAQAPVVLHAAADDTPIVLMALYGRANAEDLDNLARNIIKPKLENIPGVGSIDIQGSSAPAVNVKLDLNKLAAMRITPTMVQTAITTENVQEPGGAIQNGNKLYNLDLDLEYHSIDQLKNLVIDYRGNSPIRLSDVANINYASNSDSAATYNGDKTVGISITKKSDGNTVEVTKAVEERLKTQVDGLLPNGIHLKVVYKAADYIMQIISSLERDIWLSILAAGLVIFLFLRNIRSTTIIITAMPISILGVVMGIYFLGYTFNVITLLGLILLVGVVVDDAIVVLENIDRHGSELKYDREKAAIEGTNQVHFAVMASSLTLVSIFVPVIFMSGIIGLFFRSFAVVVSIGVIISLFVSLTLTPVLCARFLSFEKPAGRMYLLLEKCFQAMDNFYRKILNFSLNRRWLIVILAAVLVGLSLPIFKIIGKEFLPADLDTGTFYIKVQTSQGSSKDYTASKVQVVENVLKTYKDIDSFYSAVSPANQATITVNLKPAKELTLPQQKIMSSIDAKIKDIPGAIVRLTATGHIGSMTFALLGEDYDNLLNNGFTLYDALSKHPELGPIYLDLSYNQPGYVFEFDRELSDSLGFSARDIASTLMILGGGVKVAHFSASQSAKRSDILLKTEKDQFTSPEDLSQVFLQTSGGKPVRIDTILKMYPTLLPVKIQQQDLAFSLSFSAAPSISLDKASALVEKIAKQVLPAGYYIKLTGNAASLQSTGKAMLSTLVLIFILIYMVLASQFNSFIQPLIILVAQPLALIGGILILWLTKQTLNIYSMIGILLLMGLVAKNSILLIDLTNQLRKQGKNIRDALIEACPLRMRPVLMTSLAIIFAMLPAAILQDAGASTERPLALVIIGGMVSSTLLTLIVVPALYSLIENALLRIRSKT